jgi:AcrR family transcriptional regulator
MSRQRSGEEDSGSKQRIMAAAAAVFAERGYDGARMDEIAKRASVNKALIYYYYPKGKEELLERLFRETLETAIGLMAIPEMKNFTFDDRDGIARLLHRFLDVLEERQDILRVMLMESLKRSPVNDLIFEMIREIVTSIFEAVGASEESGVPDREFAMVMEFFTGVMPLLSYVVYHEGWMERFGVAEADLRSRFIAAFIGTHFDFSATAYTRPLPMEDIAKAVIRGDKEA